MKDKDTFLYFGYASNLDISTLESRLGQQPKLISQAVLPHYGFRFNYQNPDGSARANIIESKNESVYGLLFEVSESDKDYFLKSEPGYDFVEHEIFTKNGSFRAFTFISDKIVKGIFPHQEYLETIINGGKSNNIPSGYLASIINRAGKIR
ncbi:gamma-glutamylcyclotransferase [Belliella sp. DSM 107340]|uniref:Gamma-glutamylcyclotransferase n=1 Tax=Belliella calami TaxID=2923436 RepID=A0ABS9UMK1_9BACT|nr:gamma-glutamylcyclotransferase family protein [Belliella calami]MCH7397831.1 gamma-glutamylcyclotransferase [Belliella calami]